MPVGTGPRQVGSLAPATPSCGTPRDAGSPSRPDRPPGPVLDVGAGDGALLDALALRGREALGLERQSSRPDISATGSSSWKGSGRRSFSGTRWSIFPTRERRSTARPRCCRPAACASSPSPTRAACRLACSALAGWRSICPPSRSPVRRRPGGPAAKPVARGGACQLLARGQVVFGWLHGLVGLLPGDLDLYDAIRRSQAQSRRRSPANRAVTLGAGALLLIRRWRARRSRSGRARRHRLRGGAACLSCRLRPSPSPRARRGARRGR